jgi:hypothetical protein
MEDKEISNALKYYYKNYLIDRCYGNGVGCKDKVLEKVKYIMKK